MGPPSSRRVKYYGLVNQGATCYLNSVLQVLFMTQDFRETVQSYYLTNAGAEHIDSELSDLFNNLATNHSLTRGITDKLRIHNVYVQQDAAEHYEKILRLTSPSASQIFHGELVNRTKCQDCGAISESSVGFWHLPLPLVNNNNGYSVEKGIEDFFRPSVITGDDQMYCENCDKKCDAVLDCDVKHYPEVLVLLLKRFEMIYDEYSVRKVKINCPVKMSDTLELEKNYTYKLYAFVEHFGELQSGHYKAKIKSPDNERWFNFDDLTVEESNYQHFQLDPTETSENVYLLFYRQQPGDSSYIHKSRCRTYESLPASVTSGTKDAHRSTEEEEERESYTAETISTFSKGYGTKDNPVMPDLKKGTILEERNVEYSHSNDKLKEAKSVKDKINKKHKLSQDDRDKRFQEDVSYHDISNSSSFETNADSVSVEMPVDTHKCSKRQKREREYDDQSLQAKWIKPGKEMNKYGLGTDSENSSSFRLSVSGIQYDSRAWEGRSPVKQQSKQSRYWSGQNNQGKDKEEWHQVSRMADPFLRESMQKDHQMDSDTNSRRSVGRSRSLAPTQRSWSTYGNGSGKSLRSEQRSAKYDRGEPGTERFGHINPTGRHCFHGSPHQKYNSQDDQLENFRREMKRNDGQRAKEGRGTQNNNYKWHEEQQARREAPFRPSSEEKPLLHTPQQCLERVEQKRANSQSRESLHRPKNTQDAADKGKKTINCSPENVKRSNRNHTYGYKNPEPENSIYSSDEDEHEVPINNTQESMDVHTLNKPREDVDLEINDRKTKKTWWRRLLCMPLSCKKKRSK